MRGSAWRATAAARSAAASRPLAHRRRAIRPTPSGRRRASSAGGHARPQTVALVTAVIADHPHPEQGYRSCVGILRLAKRYDAARHDHAPELVTADVH